MPSSLFGGPKKKNYSSIDNTMFGRKKEEDDPALMDATAVPSGDYIIYPNAETARLRRGLCANLNPKNDMPMPELTKAEQNIYTQLKYIQYIMDGAVTLPCTGGTTVGLDPVVGLVPFFGDFATAIVSCVLVARASPVLSKYTVAHMLTNVAIDASIGTIPILGDLFDVGWQANTRNVAIFEDHMKLGAVRRREIDRQNICTLVIVFVSFCLLMMLSFVACVVFLILWLTGNL